MASSSLSPAARRVLVVDDEPLIAEIVARLLPDDVVEFCANGETALRWLGAARYDVVLCDLHLPGLDGGSVAERLERDDPTHAARLVLVTGGALDARDERLLARARHPALQKPFTRAQLLASCRTAAGR
jgi:two-component system chemotaxis response regulator CheY